MKSVILAGTAALALALPSGAHSFVGKGSDHPMLQEGARENATRGSGHVRSGHGAGRPRGQVRSQTHGRSGHVRGHNWGPRVQGRWHAGMRAPGGWGGYQRPFVGYQLPRYWVNPSYYIINYANYGFQAPQQGYQWVRYYDDAVLTDPRGQVVYAQPNVQWEQYGDTYAEAEYGASVSADDGYTWDERDSVYASNGPTPAPYGTTYEQPAQPTYVSQPVSNTPTYDPCVQPYAASGQVYDRSSRANCTTDGKGYSKGYTKGQAATVTVHTAAPQPTYQPAPQPSYRPAPAQNYYPTPAPHPHPMPPQHSGHGSRQPVYYVPAPQPMYYYVVPQQQQAQPVTTTVVVNAGGGSYGTVTETTTTVTETEYYAAPKKKRYTKAKKKPKAKCHCN